MIRAITFDFWDTLAIDDSDEPKRQRLGLPNKPLARKQLFAQRVTTLYPHLSREQAMAAYDVANQRFREEWHNHHRTPGVTTRVYYAYEALDLTPEPGHYARWVREIDELVREIETMEVRIPPDFVPGLHYTLEMLAREYKLGVISDTIHTHGRGLRHLLDQHGILPYFSYLVFSDEMRASKPATAVFRQAAIGLDVVPTEIVHVGDRESNDVHGPLTIGMKAILFTGIVDRGSQQTRAHAVCRRMADLPQIVARLG
ncbi:MAG: HAD family hydrolase [Caldilineaceae bacterium]|nr:HAD family hydrolase [Caldilineaceae bacterium]